MIEIMSDDAIARLNLILSGVPKGAEKAMTGIITRTRDTARKTALEGITSVYDISAKDVRDRKNTTINVRTRKAEGGIVGEVIFSGSKIPLYRFGVTPKDRKTTGTKVTVKYDNRWIEVSPGAPVKARQLKSRPYKKFRNAFIAQVGGHTGVFERVGLDPLPIREIMGASTPQMAENATVLEKAEVAAMETIAKRTEHEITRILNGYGG